MRTSYAQSNAKHIDLPIYRIEYIPPLKLSVAEIIFGLQGNFLSARDLNKKEGEYFKFNAKRLVLAVVTQLFSSMIRAGVQYGYAKTGESIIFLHISDDPNQLEYPVCNPQVLELDEPASLHKTAIARIVAFSLQAVAAKPPPQEWHDAAAKLDTWVVDYDEIVKSNPEFIQNERTIGDMRNVGFRESEKLVSHVLMKLRPERQAKDSGSKEEKQEDNQTESSNLQTQNLRGRSQDLKTIEDFHDPCDVEGDVSAIGQSNHDKKSTAGRAEKKRKGNGSGTAATCCELSRKCVHERDYCSVACLLGLANRGYLDFNCPNIADHGQSHLKRRDFLRLMQEQLAHNRGDITDCEPLLLGESRGFMFKITLSSHGYTVVAKGVRHHDAPHLIHESNVYDHLRTIQGIHIPVCLGGTNLILPYYHRGGKYKRFFFSELRRCARIQHNQ